MIKFDPNKSQKRQELGRGSFGLVYLQEDRASGERMAVKETELSEEKVHRARNELHFTIDFQGPIYSPFITQLMREPYEETLNSKTYLFLPMEYCAGGDLHRYVFRPQGSERKQLKETQIQKIIYYVARGLKFLHERKVAHRDIKAENILQSTEDIDTADFKICDFGMARILLDRQTHDEYIHPSKPQNVPEMTNLSKPQNAPEMKDRLYDCRVDIFSLGVLTKELAYGRRDETSKKTMEDKFEENRRQPSDGSRYGAFSSEMNDFIANTTSPQNIRPSIEIVLEMPFLKNWRESQMRALPPTLDAVDMKTKRNLVLVSHCAPLSTQYIKETIQELEHYLKIATVYGSSYTRKLEELLYANRFLLRY